MNYSVNYWNSPTGEMIEVIKTDDLLQVAAKVQEIRENRQMAFVYDAKGTSVRIPREAAR